MSTQGVEFAKVSFTVGPSNGQPARQLLHDINLSIAPNTTTAFLGRSGSGKTTLLRTVNALVRPTSGRVLVGDHDVARTDPIALRRSIGYVIQDTGLFPRMTIARNIGMALELEGRPESTIRHRAAIMLHHVGLPEDLLDRYPWQLSGGQRQRVGLARAIANEPSILLMDEPFGALDPLTRSEMQTMLRDLLVQAESTTIIITHDLEEALYLADRVIFIDDGRIVADLPFNEVRTSPNPDVQAYITATHRIPVTPLTHLTPTSSTPTTTPDSTFVPDPPFPDPQLPDPQLPDPQLPDPQLPDPELPDPSGKPKQNWWEI
jgi:osmoprotectant transport system ATP-binding protein